MNRLMRVDKIIKKIMNIDIYMKDMMRVDLESMVRIKHHH